MFAPLLSSEPSALERLNPSPSLKIVTFGTSLTGRGGWQDALRTRLKQCLGREIEITTVAQAGATTAWALAHVADVASRRPDVVLVEFAVNDASLTRWLTLQRSRSNMEHVLARIRESGAETRVIVLGMNPALGLRGWLRPRLERFTAEHAQVALGMGGEFIDFRPFWGAVDLAEAVPDGLHPTASAAIRVMVPELIRRIARRACFEPTF